MYVWKRVDSAPSSPKWMAAGGQLNSTATFTKALDRNLEVQQRVPKRGEKSELSSAYTKNCTQTVHVELIRKGRLPGTQCIFMAVAHITLDIDTRNETETLP